MPEEHSTPWAEIGIALLVIFFLVVFFTMPLFSIKVRKTTDQAIEQVTSTLSQEFYVEEGIIESPSIIIIYDSSLDSFIDKAIDLGAETIYIYELNYYVFNFDLSMAWRYSVKLRYSGFLGFNMEWDNP